MIVTARAPVRVDFGGGWTDVDRFAHAAADGGVVVSAAIDKYVSGTLAAGDEGLSVSYGFDLPSGSGLGTSAALNVVWLALVQSQIEPGAAATPGARARIAEKAYALEALLGVRGGRQDQYAAALGGLNVLRFGPDGVRAQALLVEPETVNALEARCVLCYTGRPRLSGTIHESVWGAFEQNNPPTVAALRGLREVAGAMPGALRAGDLDGFADLVAQNWRHQKALDASVTTPEIDALFEAATAAGARGGKACGAGGGGCLLFIAQAGATEQVKNTVATWGARLIPFRFAFEGLTISVEGQET